MHSCYIPVTMRIRIHPVAAAVAVAVVGTVAAAVAAAATVVAAILHYCCRCSCCCSCVEDGNPTWSQRLDCYEPGVTAIKEPSPKPYEFATSMSCHWCCHWCCH